MATYLDEIPSTAIQNEYSTYDLERVEVLRGPQGTLYGEGSQGGTVRYVTRKPQLEEVEASARFGVATVGGGGGTNYNGNAMVNIPLIEGKLGLRAVVGYTDNDGIANRPDLNRERSDSHTNLNFRGQLLWKPTDRTDISFAFHHQDVESDDQSVVGLENNDVPGFVRNPFLDEIQHYNLTINHDLDYGVVTLSGTSSDRSVQSGFDVTAFNPSFDALGNFTGFTPYSVTAPGDIDVESAEIRFASKFDSPLQLVVGGYYQDLSSTFVSISAPIDPTTGVLPVNYDPRVIPEPAGQNFLLDQFNSLETKALFGEISYDITDRLNILGGIRLFNIKNDILHIVETSNDVFGRPRGTTTEIGSDDSDAVFKVQLSYQATDDALLYATWGEGFRQGGANILFDPTDPRADTAFDPDIVNNFEVGAKTTWAEGQFILNGAFYYMTWDDIQVSVLETNGANSFTRNFGAAELYGFELEAVLRPQAVPGLTISAGLTLSDQRLTEDGPADLFGIPIGEDGDQVPNAVGDSASIGIEQQFKLGSLDSLVRLDASYTGRAQTEFSEANPLFREWGDFALVNLSFGVGKDNWSASLYARNIFNDRSSLGSRSTFSPNSFQQTEGIFITRPRTIGIDLRYSF